MTESELQRLRKCLCESIVEQFRNLLKPICENINLLVDGETDLARRVEVLERQNRELKEDYVNVLKVLYEQGIVPANPWKSISTR